MHEVPFYIERERLRKKQTIKGIEKILEIKDLFKEALKEEQSDNRGIWGFGTERNPSVVIQNLSTESQNNFSLNHSGNGEVIAKYHDKETGKAYNISISEAPYQEGFFTKSVNSIGRYISRLFNRPSSR